MQAVLSRHDGTVLPSMLLWKLLAPVLHEGNPLDRDSLFVTLPSENEHLPPQQLLSGSAPG